RMLRSFSLIAQPPLLEEEGKSLLLLCLAPRPKTPASTVQIQARRMPRMLMSSNLGLEPLNLDTSETQVATNFSGSRECDSAAILSRRETPYSSSWLLIASTTPSVYRIRVSPVSSFRSAGENS